MKTIELISELKKYPVFTVNDLAKLLGKNDRYVITVAYRLRKMGLIKKVERGKYTSFEDVLQIASYIVVPSYISFWSALSFYHLTEQMPRTVMVAVQKPKKQIVFGDTEIKFTALGEFWGYARKRYVDFDIFVAEKEKAIIDCLLAKNTPFDEIVKAIKNEEIDHEKLVKFAKDTNNTAVAKRAGYIMEQHGIDASELAGKLDNNYIPLDRLGKKSGVKNRRWKVIVNRDVRNV